MYLTTPACSSQLHHAPHNSRLPPMKVSHSGPEVIKHFSCSTQLSMKVFLLSNLRLLIIANSFLLNIAEHENFSANKLKMPTVVGIFIFISRENFMLSWVEHEKKFYNLRARPTFVKFCHRLFSKVSVASISWLWPSGIFFFFMKIGSVCWLRSSSIHFYEKIVTILNR